MIISLDKYNASGGTKVEGDIAISENGIYDVTTYATANVNVQPSDNYSYFDGVIDVEGLRAIGWDDESIGYFRDNDRHYAWQNSDYIVSEENKALYGVVTQLTQLKNYPELVFAPKIQITTSIAPTIFTNCKSLKAIPKIFFPNLRLLTDMFRGCSSLTTIPLLNTSNITGMSGMFSDCSSLTSIPQFDTSKVTSMTYMLQYCTALISIPFLDTSNVTNMTRMFAGCSSLISIPQLDTSKVTNMNSIFDGCKSLTTMPLLDTSKVTNMNSMFRNCSSLTTIPLLDTSKVTDMNSMFYGCSSLTSIPQFDTSNVESIDFWLYNCTNITEVNSFNLSKISDFGDSGYSSAFYGIKNLITIGELQCDNLTNIGSFLYYTNEKLINFGGIKNLGMQPTLSGTSGSAFMKNMPNLTYESVLNVLNGLYDRASAGYSMVTLKMHANHMALLSDEDISIATSKGWTLTA